MLDLWPTLGYRDAGAFDDAPGNVLTSFTTAMDPSLTLAYWLPEFESWADLDGHPVELPTHDESRATTLIDRDGVQSVAGETP